MVKQNQKSQGKAEEEEKGDAGSGETEVLVNKASTGGAGGAAQGHEYLVEGQVFFGVLPGGA